jgi:hypothetical protein
MSAKAKEARGQGTANAGVEMRLAEENGGTTGTIHSDVAISGKAAAMGQGVIADVSGRLVDTFAQNLAAMLAGPPPEEPVGPPAAAAADATVAPPPTPPGPAPPAAADGLPILSIVGKVLAQRLRDPRVAVPALAALALLLRALRRRG